jgi:hypothetical protein
MAHGAGGQQRPQASTRRRGRAWLGLLAALALALCGSLAGWPLAVIGAADRDDAQAHVRDVTAVAAQSEDEWDEGEDWGDGEEWSEGDGEESGDDEWGEDWGDGEEWNEDEEWNDDEDAVTAPRVSVRAPGSVTLRRGRRATVRVRVANRSDLVHRATLTLRLPRGVKAGTGKRARSGTVRLSLGTLRGRRTTSLTVRLVATRRASARRLPVPLVVHASGVEAARATLKLRVR